MTLDKLYGIGSLAALARLTSAKMDQTQLEDGGVRIQFNFEPGFAKLDCYAKEVWWQALNSETDKRVGLYDALCKVVPDFLKERGVEKMLASPASDDEKKILMRRGDWHEVDGVLEWKL